MAGILDKLRGGVTSLAGTFATATKPPEKVLPTASQVVTQDPQDGHIAIDFGQNTGDPIQAPVSGYVEVVVNQSGYGQHVVLHADNGDKIVLAHLSAFNVQDGQQVNAGDVVGFAGSTGQSSGPHLHFEVWDDKGFHYDPWDWLLGADAYPSANFAPPEYYVVPDPSTPDSAGALVITGKKDKNKNEKRDPYPLWNTSQGTQPERIQAGLIPMLFGNTPEERRNLVLVIIGIILMVASLIQWTKNSKVKDVAVNIAKSAI